MIITQKYDSLASIDPDIRAELESILKDEIPNFQYLLDYEAYSPSTVEFNAILFFTNKANSPIGFCCIRLQKEKRNPLRSLFNKKKRFPFSKSLHWELPSQSSTGIFILPEYISASQEKILKLIDEYKDENLIDLIRLKFPLDIGYGLQSIGQKEVKDTRTYFNSYFKTYEDYLHSLNPPIKDLIKRSWNSLRENFTYHIEESKKLKKQSHNLLRAYQDNPLFDKFITLETENEIALILAILKKDNHYYYDLFKINNEIPETIGHQLAILQVCNKKDFKLSFLGADLHNHHLLQIGFNSIQQVIIYD